MKTSLLSFEIKTPVDMLEKAKRELRRLRAAESSPDDNDLISDHGMNFAITVWHVADWVWKKFNPNNCGNLKDLGLHTFNDLHSLIRQESDALAICFEIATGSKHLTLDKDSSYQRRVQVTDISARAATAMALSRSVLKVELLSGDRKRADEVFTAAIAYWDTFFKKFNIS
ncbi:hypothetical protein FVF58_12115 [Paraburkholderia panacisoli]|uniref:Uncharacterized protein n=1 Tax=Paraburkholderia panacisoli TaxID=2603818 RepID=A0A5B0HBH1_9BURK|nr:hypothetical protein [Paraburkholderia panacisoli]KAA1012617.1 hypothetical protein FVF58_12115 [Paraburkholderia panacisoli]